MIEIIIVGDGLVDNMVVACSEEAAVHVADRFGTVYYETQATLITDAAAKGLTHQLPKKSGEPDVPF